ACPSARSGDQCLELQASQEERGIPSDSQTHYDSLTFPTRIEVAEGWFLAPARSATRDGVGADALYGDANAFPGISLDGLEWEFLRRSTADLIELTTLGASTLVEYRWRADVPGLTDSRFALETPYRGTIASALRFGSEHYGEGVVTWNDGRDTFS